MPTTPPLWSGRDAEPHDPDHEWLSAPAPTRVRPKPPRPEPGPDPAEKERSAARRARRAAVVAACAAVLAGGVATVAVLDGNDTAPTAAQPLPPATGGRVADSRVNQIYARVQDGVVQVRAGSGSGTGFVIDANGSIVTNAHVVGSASRVQVRFDDSGRSVDAEVRGTDQSVDLAVLRVDASRAPRMRPLALADSNRVRVGDTAVAIGYPLGLDRTATAGIISGLGREIQAPNGFRIEKVIQTDAPINPGNSGGPLLDARGRVIGVNSQIATAGSRGNVGIGFAVPSNTVREVVPRLKQGQSIIRPWLGVSTGSAIGRSGAAVRDVTSGGPADQAGLRASESPTAEGGDVIVGIEGRTVTTPEDVSRAIDGRRPGESVQVDVERDGARRTVTITLGRRPNRVGP